MALADRANEYVESQAPWSLRKQPGNEGRVRAVCSVALSLFHQIAVYLAPVQPRLAAEARALLGQPPEVAWRDAAHPLAGAPVGTFRHLMARVDPERVKSMIEASASAPEA